MNSSDQLLQSVPDLFKDGEMFSKATTSISALVIRILAVVLFAGYFAARYDMYKTVKHIPHHVSQTPISVVITGVVCNPIYFYCLGLWFMAGVFGRLKRGEAFTPAVLADLKGLAACLMAGGLFGTLIFPLINALVSPQHYFGFHGVDLTMGLLGVALLVVSRQGQRLRGELDQFV
jgi:hypothetical protein